MTDRSEPSSGDESISVPGVSDLARIEAGSVYRVYRGHETGSGRSVAVKVLPRPLDRGGRALFDRERNRLARLKHIPTILQLDSVDVLADGRTFLVSELCAESLDDRLRAEGPLPADEVRDIGRDLAEALARAHEIDLVHGAVTPTNVLFRRSGQVVLADFGTALRQSYGEDQPGATSSAAPETLRDGVLSAEADLYGLGAVLYTALVGRPPFPSRVGENPNERILRAMSEPAPRLDDRLAGPELAELIADLLSTDPEDRPAGAEDVLDRLEGYEIPESLRTAAPAHPPSAPTEADAEEPEPEAREIAEPEAREVPEPDAPDVPEPEDHGTPEWSVATTVDRRDEPEAAPEVEPAPEPEPASDEVERVEIERLGSDRPERVDPKASGTERSSAKDRWTAAPWGTGATEHRDIPALPEDVPSGESGTAHPEPIDEPVEDEPVYEEPTYSEPAYAERRPSGEQSGASAGEPPAARGGPSSPAASDTTLGRGGTRGRGYAEPRLAGDGSTDWSELLGDVLGGDTPRQQQDPQSAAVPSVSGRLIDRPHHAPTWSKATRRTVAVAAVIVGVIVLMVVANLSLKAGGHGDKAKAAPSTTAVPSATTTGPSLAVRLIAVQDRGTFVQLTWSGAAELQYAVVIAKSGTTKPRVVLTHHKRELRVTVARDTPYCFLVQATDGSHVVETQPKAIRDAVCRNS